MSTMYSATWREKGGCEMNVWKSRIIFSPSLSFFRENHGFLSSRVLVPELAKCSSLHSLLSLADPPRPFSLPLMATHYLSSMMLRTMMEMMFLTTTTFHCLKQEPRSPGNLHLQDSSPVNSQRIPKKSLKRTHLYSSTVLSEARQT